MKRQGVKGGMEEIMQCAMERLLTGRDLRPGADLLF